MNINRFIRNTIYALKRDYGSKATLYVESTSVNISTGVKTKTQTPYVIKKAIVLPTDWHRKFAYDLSFVAANKNFTYGGFFDVATKTILVDVKDLPTGFVIELKHKFIVGTDRFSLSSVSLIDDQGIWVLTGKAIKGENLGQVITVNVDDTVVSTEATSGIPE